MTNRQHYLELTIEVLMNLKYSDTCEIIKEEHLIIIFEEVLNELKGDTIKINNSVDGFSEFRKTIISIQGLDSTTKINLLKAMM